MNLRVETEVVRGTNFSMQVALNEAAKGLQMRCLHYGVIPGTEEALPSIWIFVDDELRELNDALERREGIVAEQLRLHLSSVVATLEED